ncbi:MAG: tetratricopeptide repeat protein [Candidatus Eremiobacteraeota bacterium]|nr:tetratricopeptide repeat protein [Candidatus Eremiobacteraeota bacterium]MBC5827420.1 tetratricopeptide repeat protein [Candidatus Eremiobacteraeota bacterium]
MMTSAGDQRFGAAELLAQNGEAAKAVEAYLDAATVFLNDESDMEKMRRACAAAYELDPASTDVMFLMGQADVIEGKNQAALTKFIEVLRRTGLRHVPALFETGCIYQANGQYDQAILAFKKTLDRDKTHVQAIVHIGQLHQTKGMLPEALRYYIQAAEVARESGQLGTARQLLHMVLALDSGQQRARHLMDDVEDQWTANSLLQAPALGAEAADALSTVVAPTDSVVKDAAGLLADSIIKARGELADVRAQSGATSIEVASVREQLAGAETAFARSRQELEGLDRQLREGREALQALIAERASLELVVVALAESRPVEAEQSPDGPPLGLSVSPAADHAARGHLALAEGDYRHAADAFRLAIQADPQHADAAFQLGCLLTDRFPDYDAAERLLKIAQQLRPHHVPTAFRLAVAQAERNDVVVAVESLTALARAHRSNAELLDRFVERLESEVDESPAAKYRLGIAYRELGRLEEALVVLQKIQRDSEFMVLSLNAIGLCLRRQGLDNAAAKRFKRAIGTPGYPDWQYNEALYNFGELCELKADPESLSSALSSFEDLYAQNCTYRDVGDRIRSVNGKLEAMKDSKLSWLPTRSAEAVNDR